MKKLAQGLVKLILPEATAQASPMKITCHFGCGRNGVYNPGRTINGKLPCC